MIYKKISWEDYWNLPDQTGAYLVLFFNYKSWYFNGFYHREDGPAIEWANGDKFWYFYGERHREDGPAVECVDGAKEWWINDFLHREDGPAIEWADGTKSWYLHGKEYETEEEWGIAKIKDLIV